MYRYFRWNELEEGMFLIWVIWVWIFSVVNLMM